MAGCVVCMSCSLLANFKYDIRNPNPAQLKTIQTQSDPVIIIVGIPDQGYIWAHWLESQRKVLMWHINIAADQN